MFIFSCVSTKKAKQLIYVNDISNSTLEGIVREAEPKFQPGDRIAIGVGALNATSVVPYNLSTSAGASYLVEADGSFQFPQLGRLQVAGITRKQLADSLTTVLKTYVMDPIVTVQLLNFKITILGDVSSPGTKSVVDGKINLLEAIGMAGDLTIFGKRENVLIIREKNGKREYGRVDLTSTNLFRSPYYILEQNDIIYVEMTKLKIENNDQTLVRNISIASSVVSLLATIIILVINITN